ncbi:MAG: outer membrane lipoprotein-sorting protein [Spirochaetaceae bacterium]|jgi:hypothetical protein|nr:outer membrane lipoprotein-sorting protein [Spirochaetaceae bacterium]
MNKRTFFAVLLLGAAAAIMAQDAAAIVDASRNRIQADTVFSRNRMVVTTKKGSASERIIEQYSRDSPMGKSAVVVVLKPAGVAGTRFLTLKNPGKPDLRWLYLPARKAARQVMGRQGTDAFVATDFSLDDISSADRSTDADTHRLLPEESLAGRACHVVESSPRDKEYQYSKMISWIDKGTLVASRIDLFDGNGTLVKRLEVLETKEIQGRLTATVTKMSTLASQTSTTIYVDPDTLKYDASLSEDIFTKEFIEKGRVP